MTDDGIRNELLRSGRGQLCPRSGGEHAFTWARIRGTLVRWDYLCRDCRLEREAREARECRRLRRTDTLCSTCGASFTPSRLDGRYCSNACRQRAYRSRRGRYPSTDRVQRGGAARPGQGDD
jgi:hypothetical protein